MLRHLPVIDVGSRLHNVHSPADALHRGVQQTDGMLCSLALDIVSGIEFDGNEAKIRRNGNIIAFSDDLQYATVYDSENPKFYRAFGAIEDNFILDPVTWMARYRFPIYEYDEKRRD